MCLLNESLWLVNRSIDGDKRVFVMPLSILTELFLKRDTKENCSRRAYGEDHKLLFRIRFASNALIPSLLSCNPNLSSSLSLARSVAYFYGRVSFLCLNHSGAAHICDGMPLLFPRHDFIVVCSPSLNNSIFACIRSPNEVSSGRQKRNGESKREVSKGPIADQRRWTFLLTIEKEFFFTLIAWGFCHVSICWIESECCTDVFAIVSDEAHRER